MLAAVTTNEDAESAGSASDDGASSDDGVRDMTAQAAARFYEGDAPMELGSAAARAAADDERARRRRAKKLVSGGHTGPRGSLSCDTRLGSLVVINEEGAIEHLAPTFRHDRHTYQNAVPLPESTRRVTLLAKARHRSAMVNIYRWDPAADTTTRAIVEQLGRVIRTSPRYELPDRAAIRLQAVFRGARARGGGQALADVARRARATTDRRDRGRALWKRADEALGEAAKEDDGGPLGKMVPLAVATGEEIEVHEAAARAIKMSIFANMSTLCGRRTANARAA